MPKIVSREERREEVCAAAMRILARGGPSALTLRSLATELGGSITLVTYFFSNRADLFEAIVDDVLRGYTDDSGVPRTDDPAVDLINLLRWYSPQSTADDEREAGRISLIGMRSESASIDHFFSAVERTFREIFTAAVARIVPAGDVDRHVDFLRVGLNGLVLAVVEHPKYWSTQRREDVLRSLAESVIGAAGGERLPSDTPR